MNRKGSIEADMVFEKGKRFESRYRTPYGAMEMAVFCTKANVYGRPQRRRNRAAVPIGPWQSICGDA